MYAIAFDLDVKQLQQYYHVPSYENAYGDVGRFLQQRGFSHQRGSVYFGDPETVDAVVCMLAVFDLTQEYSWFAPAVRDIRMLRIEANNDLNPVVTRASRSMPIATPSVDASRPVEVPASFTEQADVQGGLSLPHSGS